MVTMQMSIENAFLVVQLTLFRLHTRPRRLYKARFVLQLFCVGVTNNLRAFFSQCPRALPVVVSCTWYITLMSHPSCNSSDLLHSGTRKYSLFEVHRRGNYAAYVRSLYFRPQTTCSQELAAQYGCLYSLAGWLCLSACPHVLSHIDKGFSIVYTVRTACSLSLLAAFRASGFTYAGNELNFSSLAAEAVALRLAAFSTSDEFGRWERRKDAGYRYSRTTLLSRDTAAAINLWNDFCFRWS